MTRLKDKYISEVAPALQEKFKYSSPMQIPKVDKIVLNMGVGEVKDNPKALESAMRDMGIIAGQKPVATTATKSIAAFKLREGMKIGCKVTLRGDNMYYFLDKLVSLALPRVRDFRVTMRWVSRSSLCSLKSTTTRSTRFAVWTSSLLLLPEQTKRHSSS